MYFSALEDYEQLNSFILRSPIEVSKFLQEESIRQLHYTHTMYIDLTTLGQLFITSLRTCGFPCYEHNRILQSTYHLENELAQNRSLINVV